MSLDSLFQQILFTEQQLTEQTQKLNDVKVAVITCKDKIQNVTEKYLQTKEELDKKDQLFFTMKLQCDLMKKCEEQMLKQTEELLLQKSRLEEHLAQTRTESKEEEEKFLGEISRFNRVFSLQENRVAEFEGQTCAELRVVDRQLAALHEEMELMRCSNSYMSSAEEEKKKLLLDLQLLDDTQKDLDQQMMEAQATTESLRSESHFVRQKHLTDSTCIRLRTELEALKDADLQHLHDALRSEIQMLQSNLSSSHGNEQH